MVLNKNVQIKKKNFAAIWLRLVVMIRRLKSAVSSSFLMDLGRRKLAGMQGTEFSVP